MKRWSIELIFMFISCCTAACSAASDWGVSPDPSGPSNAVCTLGFEGCASSTEERVCEPGTNGINMRTIHDCPGGSFCKASEGGCTRGPCDVCTVGELSCSADKKSVLICTRTPQNGNCAEPVEAFDCGAQDMLCDPISNPIQAADYCVNECGGRDIPLEGYVCQQDPVLICGTMICNDSTRTLKSDHTACLAGGLSCVRDDQCASCRCVSSKCSGDAPALCPGTPVCK